jgi:hypothetical protein
MSAKNEIATADVIKEQMKIIGQQMSVTNFVHKYWYIFCFRNEIVVKVIIV